MFNLPVSDSAQMSQRETALQMLRGFQISQCVYVAAKLEIFEHLVESPKHYEELAKETKTHPDSLCRFLRTLASLGVLQEPETNCFQNTSLANYFRNNQAGTIRSFLLTEIEESYACWGNLLQSLTTGEGAFETMYGIKVEEFHKQNPSQNAVYDQSMIDITAFQKPLLLDAFDFSTVETIADIGGGQGKLLAALLHRYPKLKGVLFEQPYSIEQAKDLLTQEGLIERCKLVSGDFLESIPVVADVYLLKQVLLSWNDQEVVEILKNCCQAMSANSRLLIVERIPQKDSWRDNLADLQLWMLHSGKFRSESDFKTLFAKAGLKMTRIIETESLASLVEAVPIDKYS